MLPYVIYVTSFPSGAGEGNRTPDVCLEGKNVSLYTTPANINPAVCLFPKWNTTISSTDSKQLRVLAGLVMRVNRLLSFTLSKLVTQEIVNPPGAVTISPSKIDPLVLVTGLEPARITPLDPKSSVSANSAIPAYMVRVTGLEPARVTSLDPKSSVSANSTIPACDAPFMPNRFVSWSPNLSTGKQWL